VALGKNIKGVAIEIGADTTKLGEELKKATTASKDLEKELKAVEKGLKLDPKNTELVAQKQKVLTEAVAATKDKLNALEAASAQVNEQFKKGDITEAQYRAFQREIEETKNRLAGLEKALADVNNPLRELGENMQRAGDKMVGVGKDLSMKVTAPITAVGALAVKTGADYDKAMSAIQAKSQYTADDMDRLGDGIRGVAREMGVSVVDLAQNTNMLIDSSVDAALVIEQMTHGVNLAVGTQTDLATVFDFSSSAMKTFGLEADKTQEVMDSFAAAASKGNATLEDLAGSYTTAAGAANNAGLSIHDTNAFLIHMAEAGATGTRAGTELNAVLGAMAPTSGKAAKEFERLNIELYDAGQRRDTFEVMRELEAALAGMDDEARRATEAMIFGEVAQRGWNRLMTEGIDEIAALSAELAGASDAYDGIGVAAGMAQVQQDNFAGQSAKLKAAFTEIGLVIAEKLTPFLASLTESVTKIANKFADMHPAMVTVVVALAAVAAAIGPLLVVIGTLIKSVGTILTILPKVTAAFGLLLTPMGAVVIAAAAVAAAAYLIYTNWDAIKEFFVNLWNSVKEIFSNAVEAITGFVRDWGPKILAALTGPFGLVILFVVKNWDEIKEKTLAAWNAITEAVAGAVGALKDAIVSKFQAIVDFFVDIWDAIKSVFESAQAAIIELTGGHLGSVREITVAAWDAIRGWLAGLWEDLKRQVADAWNQILGTLGDVLTLIRGKFEETVNLAKSWGSNLINNFIQGIKDGFDRLRNAVSDAVGIVGDFMGFRSPTKEGPGRQSDQWAPNFMKMFSQGILDNIDLIRDAVSEAAGSLEITPSSTQNISNMGGNTINITVQDGEDLLRTLQRMGIRI